MSLELKPDMVILQDDVSVEDAETLQQWLQTNPAARLDMAQCSHLHCANLQVMLAAKASVSAWPQDPVLSACLQASFAWLHEEASNE